MKLKKEFGLRIEKKLVESFKLPRYCHVIQNGENGHENLAQTTKYVVDIKALACDCRAWQFTGIHYYYAICALKNKGVDPKNYVHEFYMNICLQKLIVMSCNQ